MNLQSRTSSSALAVAIIAVLSPRNRPSSKSRDLLARLTALGLLLGSTVSVASSTYFVTTASDPGPAGTTSLRQAVAQANASSGNTVSFDASLVGSTITLVSGEIVINQSMTIAGPGANRLAISGNDSSRIFRYLGLPQGGKSITISGLTLTHGAASDGGAIYCYGANLSLVNSVVSYSNANTGGGVLVRGFGYAYIGHTRISGNYASNSGGGVAAYYERGLGVNASTISNNTTSGYGGGIFSNGVGKMIVEYSLISGNTIFGGNPQFQGGGGIAVKNASVYATLKNSTISGNSTYGAPGGGIGVFDATSGYQTNCYFSTIAGNYSGGGAGNGIYSQGVPLLNRCIVANNASRIDNFDLSGAFGAIYTLIRNPGTATFSSYSFGNIFNEDPRLGPLADNGGATLTMLPAPDSPAIDGVPFTASILPTDQRGLPRPTGLGGDMGAVERQYPEDHIFRNGFDPG